jgi:hypothetical protein
MCEAEHKAKLAEMAKATEDGISLTPQQKAYRERVNG